jgi:hypothetical protein
MIVRQMLFRLAVIATSPRVVAHGYLGFAQPTTLTSFVATRFFPGLAPNKQLLSYHHDYHR